jgi:predicted alpha-1,2-mannosidase
VQTNFQGLLIASAYNVGIRDFDVQSGYEAALKNELVASGRNLGNGKYDLNYFLDNKYVPYKDTVISNGWVFNFGSSHTLEYAFSSYAVGQMAKSMNDQPNYLRLSDQATYFRNLFDPETRLMRPKFENGLFISDFDPMKAWDGFQEGNAWQYTWYVPHDPAALIELVGDSLFNARLENMFDDAEENQFGSGTDEIHSFSAIEKLYNHGNQPSLHNAWLFNYSGRPWLTQKWVRSIADHFYGNDPLHGYGVGQDEDQGQLGAWYVMAALGLFDVQGHSSAKPSLQLSAPFFDQIIIQLDQQYFQGAELIIEKSGSNPDDLYIQSVTWNGQEISNCWIYREALMKGGRLVFTLGSEPNEKWGVKIPPPSMSNEK